MTRRHDFVFEIPAGFILDRVVPTGSEVLYGLRHGWLSRGDLPQIAHALASSRPPESAVEHGIVRAVREDPGLLDELIFRNEGDDYLDQRDKVWLFLGLARMLEAGVSLPSSDVDSLYADFGHPPEIEGIVSFMPADPGEPTGPHVLADNLRRFVRERATYYRERDERRRQAT